MLKLAITSMNIAECDDRSLFTVFRSLGTASPQAKREKLWVSTVKLAAVSNRISECRVISAARNAQLSGTAQTGRDKYSYAVMGCWCRVNETKR
jgi:hypothetical protein